MKKHEMSSKNFIKLTLTIVITVLVAAGTLVAVIDPMMHFHAPLKGLSYPLKDEFYLNPGIARHYDYDAVIVGDSCCQNFFASDVKDLWGYETVKLTNQGAPFSETKRFLDSAFDAKGELKLVIMPVNPVSVCKDAYVDRYERDEYYLSDKNVINDARYLFNLQMIKKCLAVISDTRAGKETWNMDMYSNWEDSRVFGGYQMLEETLSSKAMEDYSKDANPVETSVKNVTVNIINPALEHPDTEFIVFIPPYHASYFKILQNIDRFDTEFMIEKAVIEALLKTDNIKVYSFMDDYEITSDWNMYCDFSHCRQNVNRRIMNMMYNEEHIITKDNYLNYLDGLKNYYSDFDYDELLIKAERDNQ